MLAGCEGFDGVIAIGGCDKNMPGCLIGLARLNRPSIFIYGGTIMPGSYKNKKIDIVSVFEAVGQFAKKEISEKELKNIEEKAIPGPGSCGGMYTANLITAKSDALIKRMESEGESSPADLFITVDVGRLDRAKRMGLLQNIDSFSILNKVSPYYVDISTLSLILLIGLLSPFRPLTEESSIPYNLKSCWFWNWKVFCK